MSSGKDFNAELGQVSHLLRKAEANRLSDFTNDVLHRVGCALETLQREGIFSESPSVSNAPDIVSELLTPLRSMAENMDETQYRTFDTNHQTLEGALERLTPELTVLRDLREVDALTSSILGKRHYDSAAGLVLQCRMTGKSLVRDGKLRGKIDGAQELIKCLRLLIDAVGGQNEAGFIRYRDAVQSRLVELTN